MMNNEDAAAAAAAEGVVALFNNSNAMATLARTSYAENNANANNEGGGENRKLLLSWSRFNEHINASMARLMTDSTFSDIILATGDKRMVYAHKFILAYSSRYFQRILRQTNRQRGAQLVVALPEVNYDVLKILMNYMYRGESQVTRELLPAVIKTGRLLEINGLINFREANSTAEGASIWTRAPTVEIPPPPCPEVQQPTAREEKKETRANARSKRGESTSGTQNKRKTRNQNSNNNSTPARRGRGGNVRRFRPILPKDETATATATANNATATASANNATATATATTSRNAKKEDVNLPAKRKYTRKDNDKEGGSSTNGKNKKNTGQQQEPNAARVKRGKLEGEPWNINNPPAEEEEQFEIDDINEIYYNELYCDTCNEHFSSAPEWVRHMADQHEEGELPDETPGDTDDEPEPAVYNCVICSEAMYSASEWIQHIRVWHTDSEPIKGRAARRGGRDPRDPRDGPGRRKYAAA